MEYTIRSIRFPESLGSKIHFALKKDQEEHDENQGQQLLQLNPLQQSVEELDLLDKWSEEQALEQAVEKIWLPPLSRD